MRKCDRLRELSAVCACLFLAANCAATPEDERAVNSAPGSVVQLAAATESRADGEPHSQHANSQLEQAAAGVPSQNRRALLIGINEYVKLPDLRGAVNDVETIRQTLITRMGFASERITLLVDESATREGMLAAMNQLADEAQPNDFVYLHYSGHGSQASDVNGDEQDDDRDETLVPHDGRTPGVTDITDDELAAILDRIESNNILVVLDSCHSGTATRSLLSTRAVEMDQRTSLYEELDKKQPRTRAILPIEASHVLLTAAAPHQKALDGPVDGRSHGLFSHALNKSLASGGPSATPREILIGLRGELERVKAQLGLRNMPEPQLEGPKARLDRALVIFADEPAAETAQAIASTSPSPASSDLPRLPFATVEPSGSGEVLLRNGVAMGALPNSAWAIYPPGEVRFHPGAALAQAQVVELRGDDAIAQLDPRDAEIASGARAIVVAPPPPAGGIAVGWLEGPRELRKQIENAVKSRLPDVEFVKGGEFARFLLEIDGSTCTVFGADGVYEVTTLSTSDVAALATQLASLFSRSMTTAELLALDNPAAEISLEVSVGTRLASRDKRGLNRALLVVADTSAPVYRIRKKGESRSAENSLQLAVKASDDCYLTVVDVDPEGAVSLLFPNRISESKGFYPDGLIPGNEQVLIPDSLQKGNRAGFHIDYAPPAGTDTVRGFCVTNQGASKALRASIERIATATRGFGTRGGSQSPGEVLRSSFGGLSTALAGVTSRGLKLVASDEEEDDVAASAVSIVATAVEPTPAESLGPATDWSATSLTIHVQE